MLLKIGLVLTVIVCLFDVGLCDDFKLIILHNNDMHSRFEETSASSGTCKESNKNKTCYGGFARTAHVIREFRESSRLGKIPDVLYLNAGDTYTGTTWFSVHKWKICADFINVLDPDAMSLGNHEFDTSVAGLVPFIQHVKSPIVAANLDFRNEPTIKGINKSVILDVKGHKIGIIGYLTPETIQISYPKGVIFNEEVAAIKNESEKLDRAGVKIIIALGHSGFLVDKKIAAEVPLVDAVIGGHTNTFLWSGKQPDLEKPEGLYPTEITQKSGKKVPVVQAYAYTKYLGVLNLTFNDNGDLIKYDGAPILLNGSIPQDKDVLDRLETYRGEITKLNKLVVGKTKVVLDGNTCREKECNLGNLIADSMVQYVASVTLGQYWTHAPIGLANGGGIRNGVDPDTSNGNITRGDLLSMLPFENNIYTFEMKGSDLIETLEQGVRGNGETSFGEFLQVSGLKIIIDKSKPPMHRIVSAKARCGQCEVPHYEDIDKNANYTIVSYTFLIDGGDGHTVLKNKSFNKKNEDILDIDVLQWYLEKFSPVYPEVQGRILFADQLYDTSGGDVKHLNSFVLLTVFLMYIFSFKNIEF